MLRKGSIALLVLSMHMGGCDQSSLSPAKAKSESKSDSLPRSVQLQAAQKQFLTIAPIGDAEAMDMQSFPGRVTFRPQAQSAVGATAAGRVVAQLVRAGEAVKEGAPVLIIESADAAAARASLEQAATRLSAAENAYRRNIEMVEKGVGLEAERQEADARLKEARAEYERSRHAVSLIGGGQGSRVTVRAPTNGVVMSIRVAVGATVAPGGEPLLEMGDPSRLQVVAQVPENDVGRIAVGQNAEVELPALNARVAARVESFNPRVDPESRRIQVYLALAKRIDGVRPGMMAQVALRVAAEARISVPNSAVLIKDGKRRVVYVERADGAFEARDVETGRSAGGRVAILRGLSAGDRVVVRGALLLDTQAEQLL